MKDKWLSLSAAADVLGVHPSTVRNWADQGRLPVHRTQGGHRRFLHSELDLWNQSQRVNHPDETTVVIQNALGYTRLQISEGMLSKQEWYGRLDENARAAYRHRGRELMRGLMKFMTADDDSAVAEAKNQGYQHASLSRRYGLSVSEAVQAFLFFRIVLIESMLSVYESAAVSSPFVWGDMLRKTNSFTDKILLTLLDSYHVFNHRENT